MVVRMKGLIIAGAVILFFVLLFICPVILFVKLGEENVIYVRYLFYKLPLYPKKAKKPESEKKKKPKKEKKQQSEEGEQAEEKAARTASETIELIMDLAKASASPVFHLLRHTYLVGLDLRIDVGGEDASEVALNTARYRAAVGYFIGLFRQWKIIKALRHAAIRANFLRDDTEYRVQFRIMIRLGTIVYALLAAGVKFLIGQLKKPSEDRKSEEAKEKQKVE